MSFQFLTNEALLLQANHNCISPQIDIQGSVSSRSDLYIDNSVQGNISSAQTVFVSAQAHIVGDILAENIVVWGKIDGSVQAKNIAAIGSSAQIGGELIAKKIILMPNPDLPKNIQLQA
jgi:cytoskeletal protein CcmA (bactofilin family)